MSIEQWIYETIGSDSLRQAALLASLSPATLSRQLTNKSVTVETAVKIARAYQVSVIPALMALDIMTENDIAEFASEAAIQDASDEVLSTEVLRRMKTGSAL
jgi:DNA-binding helix-turn-helix protein